MNGDNLQTETELRKTLINILNEKTLHTWLVELGGVSLGILNSDVNFWAQILFSLFTIFKKK